MSDDIRQKREGHYIELCNRTRLYIGGTKAVVGFDDSFVELLTVDGMLTVEGKDLRLTDLTLDRGEVSVEGTINELIYRDVDSGKSEGLIRRKLKKP